VRIEGAAAPLLRIDPGGSVEMGPGVSLIVGQNSAGSLSAGGTTGRVSFTSASAAGVAGDWSALVFDAQTDVGSLIGVDFSFCGDPTDDAGLPVSGCVGVIDVAPTISSCSFDSSSTNGVDLVGAAAPQLDANVFTNIAGNDVD
jgi:hypothetical protein